MPRPPCPRVVSGSPAATYFKPAGIPLRDLRENVLPLDQFEAVRLADLEQLDHQESARRMGVSRQTFGRILRRARSQLAHTIVHGEALRIESPETS